MFVAAADDKQDEPPSEPATAAASTSPIKAETERNNEEIIQAKETTAPTEAGEC